MQKQLAALAQTVGSVFELQTITQRYGTPFAYIKGARHSNLSGSGSFAVPRIVGILVEIASAPPTPIFSGVPNYISDLGWISLGTRDGMIDEIRLTRQFQVWTPDSAPTATTVGLALREGVVAHLTELYAEP